MYVKLKKNSPCKQIAQHLSHLSTNNETKAFERCFEIHKVRGL